MARHWRGGPLRLDIEQYAVPEEASPILVVTAVSGGVSDGRIKDPELGSIELSDEIPSESERTGPETQYQSMRPKDDLDGEGAVQAFIAALPDWKQEFAHQFDHLVEAELPGVRRDIRWHQPFYRVEGEAWIVSFHAFTNNVKPSVIDDQYLEP